MKVIGFTGAGGVGKSTVAQKIGHNIPSVVDKIRKLMYGKDAKYGDLCSAEFVSFQNLILMAQFHSEIVYRERYKNENTILIPVERSSIDYAAYMLHLKDEEPDYYRLHMSDIGIYLKECIEHANKYDGIVYFPTTGFLAKEDPDSSKERTLDSIKITDKHIKELLLQLEVPILTLRSTTIEERVKEILDFYK